MKIEFFTSCPYTRPLATPLVTSQNTITSRRGIYLCLRGENEIIGYGEVCGGSDQRQLASLSQIIGQEIPETPAGINNFIDDNFTDLQPVFRFAIESALCDLAAKTTGKPLAGWINPEFHNSVPVNYLMPSPPPDWGKFRKEFLPYGYKAVKIKVGSRPKEEDIKFVAQVREYLGKDIEIRLDANRAFDFDRAVEFLTDASRYNISYIEEPLTCFHIPSLIRLKNETGIDIALDESLVEENYNPILLDKNYCKTAIIKPALTGGLQTTLRFYSLVKKSGIKPVITSNLETEIGMTALIHLTAAIPGSLVPMGLDTMRIYSKDVKPFTEIVDGTLKTPTESGLGNWECLCQPMDKKE